MSGHSFRGASNQTYEYLHVNIAIPANVPAQAGTYILATTGTALNPIPLLIGETSSIRRALLSPKVRYVYAHYRDALCYLRFDLSADSAARRAEIADLAKRHDPPMGTNSDSDG